MDDTDEVKLKEHAKERLQEWREWYADDYLNPLYWNDKTLETVAGEGKTPKKSGERPEYMPPTAVETDNAILGLSPEIRKVVVTRWTQPGKVRDLCKPLHIDQERFKKLLHLGYMWIAASLKLVVND